MTTVQHTEEFITQKGESVRLKTWYEVEALFNKHLKPIDHGPKGQPIYLQADIDELLERLNVRLPEDL